MTDKAVAMFGCTQEAIDEALAEYRELWGDRHGPQAELMLAMSMLSDAQEQITMIKGDVFTMARHSEQARQTINKAKYLIDLVRREAKS